MKKFHVWTKGPYGQWEKATADALDFAAAEKVADIHRASGAECLVKTVPANKSPENNGGQSG